MILRRKMKITHHVHQKGEQQPQRKGTVICNNYATTREMFVNCIFREAWVHKRLLIWCNFWFFVYVRYKDRDNSSDSEEDDEEISEEELEPPKKAAPSKRGRKPAAAKAAVKVSDEDEEEEEDSKKRGRRACMFGKKCYRFGKQLLVFYISCNKYVFWKSGYK